MVAGPRGHIAAEPGDGRQNVRDHIGLLTLAQHEDGVPQAIAVYDQKEGTPRCEQTAAAALIERLPALDDKHQYKLVPHNSAGDGAESVVLTVQVAQQAAA